MSQIKNPKLANVTLWDIYAGLAMHAIFPAIVEIDTKLPDEPFVNPLAAKISREREEMNLGAFDGGLEAGANLAFDMAARMMEERLYRCQAGRGPNL